MKSTLKIQSVTIAMGATWPLKFKHIHMKTSIYRYLGALVLLAGSITSCNEFLDINEDPSFPAEATNQLLLPSAQAGASLAFANMLERGPATLVQHYINGRFDNYGFDGSTYNNDWNLHIYSGALKDYQVIIEQGTELEEWQHVGVAKIHTAYIFSLMVDLFGDVPFSEALQSQEGNFNPRVDLGQDIYPELLEMIDEGMGDLDKESTLTLGAEDLFYGGDLSLWKKMANTLKLKMYNQTRLVDEGVSTDQINALLAAGNIISSSDEDFTFQFTTSNAPEGRHPNFQADYAGGNLENNLSSFFIALLEANDDPRIPYYFYKQTGCNLAGVNGGEGSNPGDDDVRALHGIYPVGGRFDDNSCELRAETFGLQGAGIFPMLTYTMVLFMQAEAALELGTTGDPRELLEAAINAAMTEIGAFSGVPVDAAEVTNYVNARLAAYDAATDDEGRLAVIMTEKYVSLFGNGIESYNDFRRTGYPQNLNTPVIQNGPFPRRFPIPPVEVTSNINIDVETDLTKSVFWDLN